MPKLPAFKKFNKLVKDLLDIDYGFTVSDTKTSASGVKVETNLEASDGVSGGFKFVVKENDGELTGEFDTSGDHSLKVKMAKVVDNLDVTVKAATGSKNSVTVTGDFSQDQVAFSSDLSVNNPLAEERSANLKANLVGGADGFAGGVQVAAALHPEFAIKDYDFAGQYAEGDVTATVTTGKKLSLFNLFLSFKQSNDLLLGAHASYTVPNDEKSEESPFNLIVGAEVNIDENTKFNANVDRSGLINTALEYGLASPSCTATFSTQFQAGEVKNYGVGLEF